MESLLEKLASGVLQNQDLIHFFKKQSEGELAVFKSQCVEHLSRFLSGANCDFKALLKGFKVTEEHFEAFYKEFSKQLKTMKVGIKIVSAMLKKVNLLRD